MENKRVEKKADTNVGTGQKSPKDEHGMKALGEAMQRYFQAVEKKKQEGKE